MSIICPICGSDTNVRETRGNCRTRICKGDQFNHAPIVTRELREETIRAMLEWQSAHLEILQGAEHMLKMLGMMDGKARLPKNLELHFEGIDEGFLSRHARANLERLRNGSESTAMADISETAMADIPVRSPT